MHVHGIFAGAESQQALDPLDDTSTCRRSRHM